MERLVAARGSDLPHHVLASEFLDVIGGAARTIFGSGFAAHSPDLLRQIGSRECHWGRGQCQHRVGYPAHSRLMEIDSTDHGLPHVCRMGKIFHRVVADEAGIHAAHGI